QPQPARRTPPPRARRPHSRTAPTPRPPTTQSRAERSMSCRIASGATTNRKSRWPSLIHRARREIDTPSGGRQDSRLVQHLDHDDTTLAYEDTGTGDPAFVFVHGWTCNHTHFAPQVEHFRRRHRTVAVDLRGHGASDAPEQEYTISGFADDVAWLCE